MVNTSTPADRFTDSVGRQAEKEASILSVRIGKVTTQLKSELILSQIRFRHCAYVYCRQAGRTFYQIPPKSVLTGRNVETSIMKRKKGGLTVRDSGTRTGYDGTWETAAQLVQCCITQSASKAAKTSAKRGIHAIPLSVPPFVLSLPPFLRPKFRGRGRRRSTNLARHRRN